MENEKYYTRGETIIFKILALSKIPYLILVTWFSKRFSWVSKPITLQNLQNKISFNLFNTECELERGMKWRLLIISTISFILNGYKLSIQFPKLGKKYSKKVKVMTLT